jgi:hypothetical protein
MDYGATRRFVCENHCWLWVFIGFDCGWRLEVEGKCGWFLNATASKGFVPFIFLVFGLVFV